MLATPRGPAPLLGQGAGRQQSLMPSRPGTEALSRVGSRTPSFGAPMGLPVMPSFRGLPGPSFYNLGIRSFASGATPQVRPCLNPL